MSIELLNDLLDSTVDQLADMPVFKARPAGTYKAQYAFEIVAGDGDSLPYFKHEFKLIEPIELVNPEQAKEIDWTKDVKVGIYAFPLYKDKESGEIKRSDRGEGITKLVVMGLQETVGGSNNRETLEAGNGSLVAVTIGIEKRKDKDTGEIKENNKLVAVLGLAE